RANEQDEIYGLDRKEHGHVAYHELLIESDEEEENENENEVNGDIEVGHAAAYGATKRHGHGGRDGVQWDPKAYLAINSSKEESEVVVEQSRKARKKKKESESEEEESEEGEGEGEKEALVK